jgi:hypothetical protein
MRIARLLRGIVKTAITWAVVWVPLSLIPFGLATLFGARPPSRVLVQILISQLVTAAINGGVFASVLAIAGRRKTFETLSLRWIAACGAVGGVVFPVLGRALVYATLDVRIPATALVGSLVTNAVLGAGLATMTLSLARRAPALPRASGLAQPAVESGAA